MCVCVYVCVCVCEYVCECVYCGAGGCTEEVPEGFSDAVASTYEDAWELDAAFGLCFRV